MRQIILALGLVITFPFVAAAEGRWQKTANDGCLVWNANPQQNERVTWRGPCVDGKAEGKGLAVWSFTKGRMRVIVRYDGEMRQGTLHGRGTLYGPNGDRAEGEWRRGQFHGKGSYAAANGSRYVGGWRYGKKHGHGTFVASNGDRYEGAWRADTKQGRGIYYFANGNRYEGPFVNGKVQGIGKCFSKEKNRWAACEMRNNVFVRWLEQPS